MRLEKAKYEIKCWQMSQDTKPKLKITFLLALYSKLKCRRCDSVQMQGGE